MQPTFNVRVTHELPGRALYIAANGSLYCSQVYNILRSDDCGVSWTLDASVPRVGWRSWLGNRSLPSRLLRYYVAAFQVMDDGARIAVARDGVYRAEPGEINMRRVFRVNRGSRPINITVDGIRVLFGEYGNGYERERVAIYASEDGGRHFDVAYNFPRGSLRHLHNVQVDPFDDCYWVFAGDFDAQPGIMRLSKDFRSSDWIRSGDQKSRAVSAFIEKNDIVYGTDSDQEQNFIVRVNKNTGRLTELLKIEGSSLHAAKFGDFFAISTCVEPNPVCTAKECALYLSKDGDSWRRFFPLSKDRFHPFLFQFGELTLPYCRYNRNIGMFSGQSVKNAHNLLTIFEIEQSSSND